MWLIILLQASSPYGKSAASTFYPSLSAKRLIMSSRVFVFAAAAAALPTAAQADDAEQASKTIPNAIMVTGRGLPRTPADPAYDITQITREKITSSASGRIEDVLNSVAGFQQFRRSDSRSSNPSAQG